MHILTMLYLDYMEVAELFNHYIKSQSHLHYNVKFTMLLMLQVYVRTLNSNAVLRKNFDFKVPNIESVFHTIKRQLLSVSFLTSHLFKRFCCLVQSSV